MSFKWISSVSSSVSALWRPSPYADSVQVVMISSFGGGAVRVLFVEMGPQYEGYTVTGFMLTKFSYDVIVSL